MIQNTNLTNHFISCDSSSSSSSSTARDITGSVSPQNDGYSITYFAISPIYLAVCATNYQPVLQFNEFAQFPHHYIIFIVKP